jgi:hypothetical protein
MPPKLHLFACPLFVCLTIQIMYTAAFGPLDHRSYTCCAVDSTLSRVVLDLQACNASQDLCAAKHSAVLLMAVHDVVSAVPVWTEIGGLHCAVIMIFQLR